MKTPLKQILGAEVVEAIQRKKEQRGQVNYVNCKKISTKVLCPVTTDKTVRFLRLCG